MNKQMKKLWNTAKPEVTEIDEICHDKSVVAVEN